MISWGKVKLKEICKFKYGANLPENSRIKGKYPVYGSSAIVGYHNDYYVKGPGIIVGRKGTVGKVQYSATDFFPIDTTFYIENDPKKIDLKFLFYQLRISGLEGMNSDAAVPGLNRTAAINKIINLPPLSTQQKIAKILSRYDDLIENNLKRIQLLEESAKLTYEEWFLRFRINEKKLDIDKSTGLPIGWKNKKLGDFFPIITGKKDANIQNDDGQYPFFTCSQETLRTDNYTFNAEAIILAGNGEFNVKYFRGKFEAYQRNYVLIPYNVDYLYILFLHIKHYLDLITYGSKGAVIKYLTKDMIENANFLEPTEKVLIHFNNEIIPIFHLVEILNDQNKLLKEARDILLPRFMTGMIDIERMDNSA